MLNNPAHQIAELSIKIRHHSRQYYDFDAPIISDSEFDVLYQNLKRLETAFPHLVRSDSPTQTVGSPAPQKSTFEKVSHVHPMLSLANVFDEAGIRDFVPKGGTWSYSAEPKLDGLAISLIYKDGYLTQALTRGDGAIGEDVTANVKMIKCIPALLTSEDGPSIPALFEVRGEIFILKSDFKTVNAERKAGGLPEFANPRNAAAGGIRNHDPLESERRKLSFAAYQVVGIPEWPLEMHSELMDDLEQIGIPTCPGRKVLHSTEDLLTYYRDSLARRETSDYPIDGVVFKINLISRQQTFGSTSKAPKWAVAAKFPAEEVTTTLLGIDVQVGRTGALTPVARLDPVLCGGVMVSNATLHNQEMIALKDLCVGDLVTLRRAGDVIPELVGVSSENTNTNRVRFEMPLYCPSCDSVVPYRSDEVVLRCTNGGCPAQLLGSFKHFVSRKAMDISGLGSKVIEQLIGSGLIIAFEDLYTLKSNELLTLPRMGVKKAQNILDALELSKTTTLARLIYALGIPNVGENTAKILADKFGGEAEGLVFSDSQTLEELPDIGEVVADSIYQFFHDRAYIFDDFAEVGVSWEVNESKKTSELKGKSFVITGTLASGSRTDAKAEIESRGGIVKSSVSKKTDYLLMGENPGSKYDRAVKLGIQIIKDLKEVS